MTPSDADPVSLVKRFNAALNARDLDGLLRLLTDVYTIRDGLIAEKLSYVKG